MRSDRTTSAPTFRTPDIYFPPAAPLLPPGCNRREKSADFDRVTYHLVRTRSDQREITTETIGRGKGWGLRTGILRVCIDVLVIIFVTAVEATLNFVESSGFPPTGRVHATPGCTRAYRRPFSPRPRAAKTRQHTTIRIGPSSIDTRFGSN